MLADNQYKSNFTIEEVSHSACSDRSSNQHEKELIAMNIRLRKFSYMYNSKRNVDSK